MRIRVWSVRPGSGVLLAQGERSVDALARASELGLSTASAHLQALKAANMVTTRRRGHQDLLPAGRHRRRPTPGVGARGSQHPSADVEAAASAYLGPDTEQVTRSELLERIQTGRVTVIDVRPREEYAAGHIPAAVSVPLDELAERLAELPEDHDIVAYCRGAYCVLAHEAVRMLTEHGHTAMRLAEGMLEWRLADLPVAT